MQNLLIFGTFLVLCTFLVLFYVFWYFVRFWYFSYPPFRIGFLTRSKIVLGFYKDKCNVPLNRNISCMKKVPKVSNLYLFFSLSLECFIIFIFNFYKFTWGPKNVPKYSLFLSPKGSNFKKVPFIFSQNNNKYNTCFGSFLV